MNSFGLRLTYATGALIGNSRGIQIAIGRLYFRCKKGKEKGRLMIRVAFENIFLGINPEDVLLIEYASYILYSHSIVCGIAPYS